MPIWTLRREKPATTPAPSQAPAQAAAIMETSVRNSTETAAMKTSAWMTALMVWPTLSVPGISSIRHQPPELVGRGRGRKRSDPERVEEIGDGADAEMLAGRHDRLVGAVAAGGAALARHDEPGAEIGEGEENERAE